MYNVPGTFSFEDKTMTGRMYRSMAWFHAVPGIRIFSRDAASQKGVELLV